MKHKFSRLGALALALVLALSCAVSPAWAAAAPVEIPVSVTLSPPSLKYDTASGTGDSEFIIATATYSDGSTKTYANGKLDECSLTNWHNSDTTVVGLTQTGKVTARRVGTATISAVFTDASGAQHPVSCVVKVEDSTPYPTSITLNETAVTMQLTADGSNVSYLLKSSVRPDGAVGDVTWSSSDPTVVYVASTGTNADNHNARIFARGEGTATVTATIKDKNGVDLKDTCTVTVDPAPPAVTGVNMGTTRIDLKVGQTQTLTATVSPTNADQTIVWSCLPASVATVEQNADGSATVTARGVGTATVTAAAKGDPTKFRTCTVYVTAADPSLTLEPSSLFLELGTVDDTGTVKAVVTGPVKSVDWKSNNNKVIVTPKANYTAEIRATGDKATTATITVTAEFDHATTKRITKTFTVTVADGSSGRVTDIKLNKDKISLIQDDTFQLTATLTPSNAASKAVGWTSSNTAVAAVDPDTGLVTAKGPGEATITATPRYGNVSTTCTVTVTPAATGITLIPNSNITASTTGGVTKYTLTYGRNSRDDNVTATASLTPSNSEDPILWQSSDATVVTVSGTGTTATIARKGAGSAKITAVPVGPDGKPREGVKAAELEVTVSGIKLESSTLTIAEYRQSALEPKDYGDASTNGVDWQYISSDPAVVTVDAKTGVLLGRTKGSAVITVTKGTGRYYTATCTVNVVEDASGLITLTGNHPAGTPINMSTASAASQAGSGTLAAVLNKVCQEKTKVLNADGTYTTYGLQYVTNLSVASTDQGILHDQHHSSSDTGAGVGIQDIYYPNANTSQGQRSLSDLSFVPRTTFSGTAEINYTGRSANNQNFSGVIRVTVNGTGDVMYASSEGSVVTFLADDFNLYHPSLRSVSFTPPQESQGTLYYNYTSASQPGTKVKSSDTYNRTGTPSLDRVSFVPAGGYNGTVRISYKGTDTAGRSITGTVTISVTNNSGASGSPGDIYYSQWSSQVPFRPSDFSYASWYALGESLSYVRFTLPPSDVGTLFYNYRSSGNYDSTVSSTASYYYSGSPALSGVSFVPTTTSPSQADISYTGYTTRGNTFTGTIHIGQVNGDVASNPADPSVYSGTTASPLPLSSSRMRTLCDGTLSGELSYITFTSLPDATQGKLYQDYSRFGTGTLVDTNTRYYASASKSPTIDQVSFVPKGRYNGWVRVGYTATNTDGKSVTGFITFSVTSTGNSNYFDDMSSYTWAAPAVDYLYQNGVTNGVTATSYGPNQRILRRDFVLMLCRAFNFSGGSGYSFADVPTSAYYASAVAAAKRLGIVSGDGRNFMPNSEITRQDAMVMIQNALKAAGWNLSTASASILDRFPDGASVSGYAKDAASALVQLGAVNGSNGMLYPHDSITRAEAAMILHFVMTM